MPGPRQLALSFDDAPVWDGLRLEAALGAAAGRPVSLTLTENRSVLLSVRREKGAAHVRLHHMFLPPRRAWCAPSPAASSRAATAPPTASCAGS